MLRFLVSAQIRTSVGLCHMASDNRRLMSTFTTA
jgi:hypothetical protein